MRRNSPTYSYFRQAVLVEPLEDPNVKFTSTMGGKLDVREREIIQLLQERMHSLLSSFAQTSGELDDAALLLSDTTVSTDLLEKENCRLRLEIASRQERIEKLSADSKLSNNDFQFLGGKQESRDDRIPNLVSETTSLHQDLEECYREAFTTQSEARRHQDILAASSAATIELINKCHGEILEIDKTVASLTTRRLSNDFKLQECKGCLDASLGSMAEMVRSLII
jgi:chromosome segregation ATPase